MQGLQVLVLVLGAIVAVPAQLCSPSNCKIESNCRCSQSGNPLSRLADTPQLITITFDEAISDKTFVELWQPMLFNRRNPDGKPISATFYVPHDYTDYTRVRDLYLRGFDIGVNSVSRNVLVKYWKNATQQQLNDEFAGQRTIISHFANIPRADILGARTPLLQIDGDLTMNAYVNAGLLYDNSWPTRSTAELFPYTLDYPSHQTCEDDKVCPKRPHKGFWIVPITNIRAYGADPQSPQQCNSLINCNVDDKVTAAQITQWLLDEVNRIRQTSKTPITLMLPTAWFQFASGSFEGFTNFLDSLTSLKDVFLVNHKQVIDWLRNPVPLSKFVTATPVRKAECNPITCNLKFGASERYLRSCVGCPVVYPWLGNPLGEPRNNMTDF